MAQACLRPRSRLLGPNLTRLPEVAAARGEVALTFDDGPDPGVTPHVLDLLAAHGARASFFCVGRRVEAYPQVAAAVAAAGHRLENHTHTHPAHFAFRGPRVMEREIASAQEAIGRACGRAPRPLPAAGRLPRPLDRPGPPPLRPRPRHLDPARLRRRDSRPAAGGGPPRTRPRRRRRPPPPRRRRRPRPQGPPGRPGGAAAPARRARGARLACRAAAGPWRRRTFRDVVPSASEGSGGRRRSALPSRRFLAALGMTAPARLRRARLPPAHRRRLAGPPSLGGRGRRLHRLPAALRPPPRPLPGRRAPSRLEPHEGLPGGAAQQPAHRALPDRGRDRRRPAPARRQPRRLDAGASRRARRGGHGARLGAGQPDGGDGARCGARRGDLADAPRPPAARPRSRR